MHVGGGNRRTDRVALGSFGIACGFIKTGGMSASFRGTRSTGSVHITKAIKGMFSKGLDALNVVGKGRRTNGRVAFSLKRIVRFGSLHCCVMRARLGCLEGTGFRISASNRG